MASITATENQNKHIDQQNDSDSVTPSPCIIPCYSDRQEDGYLKIAKHNKGDNHKVEDNHRMTFESRHAQQRSFWNKKMAVLLRCRSKAKSNVESWHCKLTCERFDSDPELYNIFVVLQSL
ncbi:hypothetical protein L484_016723 [Morus notabilis]|uniref:Uncharacterized protein n=1 Tax=Morus notabilis TaxID=981085 RepID=W9S3P0_9ROSA|nr:hypothetical protein L484_016723 [Morus notabilis]